MPGILEIRRTRLHHGAALDHENGHERRRRIYDEHLACLAAPLPVRIVFSGPLLAEDEATRIGSMFVVEASDRSAVQAFNAADPFQAKGVWQKTQIHPFELRLDNRVTPRDTRSI
jgi:uncharacterized protein